MRKKGGEREKQRSNKIFLLILVSSTRCVRSPFFFFFFTFVSILHSKFLPDLTWPWRVLNAVETSMEAIVVFSRKDRFQMEKSSRKCAGLLILLKERFKYFSQKNFWNIFLNFLKEIVPSHNKRLMYFDYSLLIFILSCHHMKSNILECLIGMYPKCLSKSSLIFPY